MAANVDRSNTTVSNVITIRIPPLELDILGTKIQIDTGAINAVPPFELSAQDAQTLRLALRLLGGIGKPEK